MCREDDKKVEKWIMEEGKNKCTIRIKCLIYFRWELKKSLSHYKKDYKIKKMSGTIYIMKWNLIFSWVYCKSKKIENLALIDQII